MNNNYILIDCGLIHKYLVKKSDIRIIEEETFYTITIVKELNDYEVETKGTELIFTNSSERLVFIKADNKNPIFKYFLDEFNSHEIPKDVQRSLEVLKKLYAENKAKLDILKDNDLRKSYLEGSVNSYYIALYALGYDAEKDVFWKR